MSAKTHQNIYRLVLPCDICMIDPLYFFRSILGVNSSKKDEKMQRKHLGLNLKLAYKEAEDDKGKNSLILWA